MQYTSPISFLVVGHLKTILILLLGFILFDESISFRTSIGISIAIIGMIFYSYFKISNQNTTDNITEKQQSKFEKIIQKIYSFFSELKLKNG